MARHSGDGWPGAFSLVDGASVVFPGNGPNNRRQDFRTTGEADNDKLVRYESFATSEDARLMRPRGRLFADGAYSGAGPKCGLEFLVYRYWRK